MIFASLNMPCPCVSEKSIHGPKKTNGLFANPYELVCLDREF